MKRICLFFLFPMLLINGYSQSRPSFDEWVRNASKDELEEVKEALEVQIRNAQPWSGTGTHIGIHPTRKKYYHIGYNDISVDKELERCKREKEVVEQALNGNLNSRSGIKKDDTEKYRKEGYYTEGPEGFKKRGNHQLNILDPNRNPHNRFNPKVKQFKSVRHKKLPQRPQRMSNNASIPLRKMQKPARVMQPVNSVNYDRLDSVYPVNHSQRITMEPHHKMSEIDINGNSIVPIPVIKDRYPNSSPNIRQPNDPGSTHEVISDDLKAVDLNEIKEKKIKELKYKEILGGDADIGQDVDYVFSGSMPPSESLDKIIYVKPTKNINRLYNGAYKGIPQNKMYDVWRSMQQPFREGDVFECDANGCWMNEYLFKNKNEPVNNAIWKKIGDKEN